MSNTRDNQQIAEFATGIAGDAWREMNTAYHGYISESENAKSDPDNLLDGCEFNLYCYYSGNWVIDHAQYLTDHRNIVAVIPLMLVNGPTELAGLIEEDYDDQNCQA